MECAPLSYFLICQRLKIIPEFYKRHCLSKHQSLNENQKRNHIKDMSKKKTDELKQKLEETEDTPNISDMVSILPPPKVIEKGATQRRKSQHSV